jgi:hypothetical protein
VAGTTIVASAMNTRFTGIETWAKGTPDLSTSGSMTTVKGTLNVDEAVTFDSTLTVTGAITGNVTGNCSGTAATVTTAAQPNITSVGTLTGLNLSGDIDTAQDFVLSNGEGEQILIQGSTNQLFFQTSGTYRAFLNADGDFLPYATNAYDLGSSSKRWGSLYAGATDITYLNVANGSVGAPTVKFASNAADSGFYYVASTQIGLASDTHVAMTSANGTGSSGSAAGTIATAGIDTSSTSGYQAVYRNNSYGTLYRWTSMRDTKDNIQSFTDSGAAIDALRPVTFVEKAREGESSANRAWREADIQYGFIAEEVAEVADGKFATWEDKDGSLVTNGWRQPDMISLVVAELKSVRQRLTALES